MKIRPEGAVGLAEARTAHGPWYVVYADFFVGVEKRSMCPGRYWFDPEGDAGYCFLNYFHALAYSLKVKNDSDKMTAIISQTDEFHNPLARLPAGAAMTWGQVEWLCKSSNDPIYMVIIDKPDTSFLLQLKTPKELRVFDTAIFYGNGERICEKDYFNKGSAPTFMIFDNFLHLKAFELKLKGFGYTLQTKKF